MPARRAKSRRRKHFIHPPQAHQGDKEIDMNWDQIEGNWKQLKGKVREQWGKLTDDDIDVVAGRRQQLAGKIQERYGCAKDDAEKQVAAWERSATDDWFKPGTVTPPRDKMPL
jgi:uncharacterized protein YjbJ (UPF0337 family)